ncbi:hypothetical protein METBIDRAFT_76827 [Metschnikowia bicuspidata var. bicuspidata NRRL YB-4993]|uniref:PH domain-containing protein n=1 Tax=Metschnikowia bicuspidata var. bicuspidata NRRL YB-4993 TaxID=869754 RepID=A0A1A0HIR7_9ASCO|nr:hypothetical protein METBIDRAFT_76827 [Metschnikowia bicuspidata var. bicuspidata NRRL YB-4993]OBA23905.1 hypothetical protein METBIDRAFT_76827 [Metschnikowia bicuspidata var. bicuspidata NRRL YB-4993]
METLEVQAKDFLVKWVNAPDNSSIKWQVKSLKKSINFAIYQKNDLVPVPMENLPEETILRSELPGFESNISLNSQVPACNLRSTSVASVNTISRLSTFKSRSRSSTFSSSLSNSGLILVKDYYKLLPDELVRGVYQADKGGTFAFVFDNTFSKTTGKKVLFSAKISNGESENSSKISPIQNYQHNSQADHLNGSEKTTANILWPKDGELMQGVLSKKRRKKLQGFTKRFFILNFKYGTLSYFKNNDNKLRGQMPITDAIVSADSKTNQIFIDSGMEVWNLKALSTKDLKAWVNAFSIIKKNGTLVLESIASPLSNQRDSILTTQLREVESHVKTLITNYSSKPPDAVKADLQVIASNISNLLSQLVPSDVTSIISDNEFFDANENLIENENDYGIVLMTEMPQTKQTRPENEFIDDNDIVSEKSSSESDADSEGPPAPKITTKKSTTASEISSEVNDLYPLPHDPVERDCDIPICDHYPPSILSFVRKSVGKDLSSLSMPVDMNEPITVLQKYAEILEYSDLIDNALQGDYPENSGELILRIGAFSISYLAAMRMKVRSSRKPFNPLLGETYELVREDKGFRLVCEKVFHRPPVFAMFAESPNWTLSFSPAPSQKFWGKTYEFYTSGNVKLTIRKTGEVFTWSQPTCVLKNMIAGEKFVEPSTSITVKSSSGQKAVISFAKGGMFSGRSEDLSIHAYDPLKKPLPYTVSGKWTDSMTLKTNSTEKVIWTAGELLPQSEKKFGFTKFAGSLNKITSIEEGNLPSTDSRYRPDMKVYEEGRVKDAESLKQKLEDGQRERRKMIENSGVTYKPFFFEQIGGAPENPDTGEWIYKAGELSYWERRKTHNWDDLPKLW